MRFLVLFSIIIFISPTDCFTYSARGKISFNGNLRVSNDFHRLKATVVNEQDTPRKSRTQRIMEKTFSTGQTGGAGGSSTWDAFVRTEENWQKLKESSSDFLESSSPLRQASSFITSDGALGDRKSWIKLSEERLDYDVIIAGGTLGIFFALSLLIQNPNLKICVVEGGKIRGREQEWNISRKELEELFQLGLITKEEMEEVIITEFEGCRSGFKNKEVTPLIGGYFSNDIGYECFTPNVLNLGVSPKLLLEKVLTRFQNLGGDVKEGYFLKEVLVSESKGIAVSNTNGNDIITARLLLDCMGNRSPISLQQRSGQKPDGICIVVGSCAAGYDEKTNLNGDIIYTNSEIQNYKENGQHQYFWESFPVGISPKNTNVTNIKTTYMFTYMDAEEYRPSLSSIMDDYWNLLPIYQPSITDPEKDLDFKRVLFAFFPTFKNSPLKPAFSRVLAVGDASGIQSPLSFGGFGALTRHLHRTTTALGEALTEECLHYEDLALINPYTPNLSVAWMFQKAMSIRKNQSTDPKFINRLLATNFEVMDSMGQSTITPFLQDVITIEGLVGSLAKSFVQDPTFMPKIVQHVGIPTLVDWLGHVTMMTWYTALHRFASPIVKPFLKNSNNVKFKFRVKRSMEAWEYGSGSDYTFDIKE